jgi:hypothetical protein
VTTCCGESYSTECKYIRSCTDVPCLGSGVGECWTCHSGLSAR